MIKVAWLGGTWSGGLGLDCGPWVWVCKSRLRVLVDPQPTCDGRVRRLTRIGCDLLAIGTETGRLSGQPVLSRLRHRQVNDRAPAAVWEELMVPFGMPHQEIGTSGQEVSWRR
jgi:hypothetical protein